MSARHLLCRRVAVETSGEGGECKSKKVMVAEFCPWRPARVWWVGALQAEGVEERGLQYGEGAIVIGRSCASNIARCSTKKAYGIYAIFH